MTRSPVVLLLALSAGCLPPEPADNTSDTAGRVSEVDADGDGFGVEEGDCDDQDATRHPGVAEACNGIDDDCDGSIDDGVLATWYSDADDDGFGDPSTSREACDGKPGEVQYAQDCDDHDDRVFPGADESCDGVDNDCDGAIDEGVLRRVFVDADLDGYGDAELPEDACAATDGRSEAAGDCDDTDANTNPGADESCDGVDNDCDDLVDEDDAIDTVPWFADADGDSWGDGARESWACDAPTGFVMDDLDCDDSDAGVHPGAWERCDTTGDDDCDGRVNEAEAIDATTWYLDADADGFGRATFTAVACDATTGMVANASDCDDLDASAYPGAEETCNGADDDCNGTVDDRDRDGDGALDAACGGDDCDDGNAGVNPSALEICDDGVDQDCDGTPGDCGLDGELSASVASGSAFATQAGAYFGFDIAAGGDLTGDGVDDLVVGAPYEDVGTYADGGKVYVFDVPSAPDADPAAGDARITGTADSDYLGRPVATTDYNADGIADLVVGAYGHDGNGSAAGAVAVFLGGSTLSGAMTFASATMVFEGDNAGDYAGIRLAPVGRTTASTKREGFLVGAYNNDDGGSNAGAAYLVRPSASSAGTYEIESTSLALQFTGEDSDDRAGTWVAAGDLDQTGYDDVLVGAYKDDDGGTDAGAVYVIFDGSLAAMDLADADAKFIGEVDYDYVGSSSPGKGLRDGDLDGDGYEELAIPAQGNDAGGTDAGAVYVLAGADVAGAAGVTDLAFADTRLTGEAGDYLGTGILDACDLDGDLVPDLVLGSPYRAGGTGAVSVFYGPLPAGSIGAGDADVTISGLAADDYFGLGGLCVGDVDGNGAADFAVGSHQEDVDSAGDAGGVRLFYGGWL